MRIRTCYQGETMKPLRVLLEKDGRRFGGPVSYPVGWLPPAPGEKWDGDGKHTVVDGRLGNGDDTWDEVILTVRDTA
jgi:hypothetical protein